MVAMATDVFESQRFQDSAAQASEAIATKTKTKTKTKTETVDPLSAVQLPEMAEPERTVDPLSAVQLPEIAELESEIGSHDSFPSVTATPASHLVYFTEPDSLAAEKFRFLAVRLRQIRHKRPFKRVLVTSTIPGEGKSLVSANLAGVLARRKERVLLIEGDLRRPVLAHTFGLARIAGLAEWLQSGEGAPNIYHLRSLDFSFMPAGDPPAHPLELLQSSRLFALLENLSNSFDWMIVDSPPLLPLADTTVWARLTEGTLLVAREGITKKAMLQRGLEVVKKSELLGVVLNGTNSNHDDYYQSYSSRAK